jgi:hypothetical protein
VGRAAHQTLGPQPDAPAEIGEFSPIATNVPGIHICEALSGSSPPAPISCPGALDTHNNVDHRPARTSSSPDNRRRPPTKPPQWPHPVLFCRDRTRRGTLPFVSMRSADGDVPVCRAEPGQFAGWLGRTDPLTIDHDPSRADYHVADLHLQEGLSTERLDERRSLRGQLNRGVSDPLPAWQAQDANLQRAYDLLTSTRGEQDAFDLSRELASIRERYGNNPHGQSVLQARRLIERGVPLVTVFWPNDGIKNVSVFGIPGRNLSISAALRSRRPGVLSPARHLARAADGRS